jgi:hypothetical protein
MFSVGSVGSTTLGKLNDGNETPGRDTVGS